MIASFTFTTSSLHLERRGNSFSAFVKKDLTCTRYQQLCLFYMTSTSMSETSQFIQNSAEINHTYYKAISIFWTQWRHQIFQKNIVHNKLTLGTRFSLFYKQRVEMHIRVPKLKLTILLTQIRHSGLKETVQIIVWYSKQQKLTEVN